MRSESHNSVVYIDDSYLHGYTYQSCVANILDTVKLLKELGFVIHADKSVLTPRQTIVFLGFFISSKHMTLSLTDEKKNKIKPLLINCLIYCLKYYKGNFKGKISLSLKAVSEIHWWINNIVNSCHHINNIPNPTH